MLGRQVINWGSLVIVILTDVLLAAAAAAAAARLTWWIQTLLMHIQLAGLCKVRLGCVILRRCTLHVVDGILVSKSEVFPHRVSRGRR